MSNALLSWHVSMWEGLSQRLTQNQFPHALLFHGQKGVGKKDFARYLSQALLCHQQNACGACSACALFSAESHPDYCQIVPEGAANKIRVDTVRDTIEFVQTSPLISQYKVICIDQASEMNAFSANAILKTLEEPPAQVVFILICHDHLNLPATIVSRCQKIFFSVPSQQDALHWMSMALPDYSKEQCLQALHAASGAPLWAAELLTNGLIEHQLALRSDLMAVGSQKIHPVQLAEKWSAKSIAEVVSVRQCLDWVFMELQAMLSQPTQKIAREPLLDYINYIQQLCGWVRQSQSLNRQLMMEDVFIRWKILCNS
ncbi:MAG: DNA polymerase III subunit delta' [Gammaproteobacteria bacterium]|nr:DNA polymerase III subunit delta' [Gammaproteobacteria bacterium]